MDFAPMAEGYNFTKKAVDTLFCSIESEKGGMAECVDHEKAKPAHRVVPQLDASPGCRHFNDGIRFRSSPLTPRTNSSLTLYEPVRASLTGK